MEHVFLSSISSCMNSGENGLLNVYSNAWKLLIFSEIRLSFCRQKLNRIFTDKTFLMAIGDYILVYKAKFKKATCLNVDLQIRELSFQLKCLQWEINNPMKCEKIFKYGSCRNSLKVEYNKLNDWTFNDDEDEMKTKTN